MRLRRAGSAKHGDDLVSVGPAAVCSQVFPMEFLYGPDLGRLRFPVFIALALESDPCWERNSLPGAKIGTIDGESEALGPSRNSAAVTSTWRETPRASSILVSPSKRISKAVSFSVLFSGKTVDWRASVSFAF